MTVSNVNHDITATDWLTILDQCADEADKIAKHYYESSTVKVIEKSDKSPVTEADQKIEDVIRQSICNQFPDIGVIGEEFPDKNKDSAIKLIVDPIDGTSNFIRGIPIFGTLLAIEKDNTIITGVISNGISKERWAAAKGNGATYNGTKIQVSAIDTIEESQAFFGSLYGREARGDFEKLTQLLSKTKRQRGIGDFLMHMWVAMGYGEFGIDFGLQPWDIAPIGIIVEEAGGIVTAVDGKPFNIYEGSILTSNGQFHETLLQNYNW